MKSASNQSHIDVGLLSEVKATDIRLLLGLSPSAQRVWVALRVPIDGLLEIEEVLFGPVDLAPVRRRGHEGLFWEAHGREPEGRANAADARRGRA